MSTDLQQVDIFSSNTNQQHFAELCNALYERELMSLAQSQASNIKLMQRRLAGLTHHVRRAAEHMLTRQAPIDVDIHNGSWQAKQAAKCMAAKADEQKTRDWFYQHSKMGLVVPVYISELGQEHLELDSVDRIDVAKQQVHLNKNGWYFFNGTPVKDNSHPHHHSNLLIPAKATLSAACCGHTWNHKGRSQPRALSLRELLLSTTINWKTFR